MRYSNNVTNVSLPYNYRDWLPKGKKHQMSYMLLLYFFCTTYVGFANYWTRIFVKMCCLKLRSLSNIKWFLNYYIFFHRDMSWSNLVTFSCQWCISTWWRCLYPTGQGVSSNINGHVDHRWTRIARHQSVWRANDIWLWSSEMMATKFSQISQRCIGTQDILIGTSKAPWPKYSSLHHCICMGLDTWGRSTLLKCISGTDWKSMKSI
jgi:hypothetical protein